MLTWENTASRILKGLTYDLPLGTHREKKLMWCDLVICHHLKLHMIVILGYVQCS